MTDNDHTDNDEENTLTYKMWLNLGCGSDEVPTFIYNL